MNHINKIFSLLLRRGAARPTDIPTKGWGLDYIKTYLELRLGFVLVQQDVNMVGVRL